MKEDYQSGMFNMETLIPHLRGRFDGNHTLHALFFRLPSLMIRAE